MHPLNFQRPILNFVADDSRALRRTLNHRDRDKLDECLTIARDVEQRITRAERFPETPDPRVDTPAGIPA
ncbi:MAG TPA: hypothetical protein DCY13_03285 [Verrucomicrobiales bacterium]|nr:hypothetical protein [Verrucomicrobiales bacterium]